MIDKYRKRLGKLGGGVVPPAPIRLFCSAYAKEKEGKTNFGLTSPWPIAYFDIDDGVTEIVDKFAGYEDGIIHFPIEYDIDDDKLAERETEKWLKAYRGVLEMPDDVVRSIVFDTDTEMWDMLRLAEFGQLTDVPPSEYKRTNHIWLSVLAAAKRSTKNVILLNQMKEEWVSPKGKSKSGKKKMAQWTGDFIRDCMKKVPYKVQASIHLYRDDDGYNAEIMRCRQNPQVEGEILTTEYENMGDDDLNFCSFPFVAATIYPDTDPGDWKND